MLIHERILRREGVRTMKAPSATESQKKAYLPTWPGRVHFRRPRGTDSDETSQTIMVIVVVAAVAVILMATAVFLGTLPTPIQ